MNDKTEEENLTAPMKERRGIKSRRTTSDYSSSFHGEKESKKETFRDEQSVAFNLAFFLLFSMLSLYQV